MISREVAKKYSNALYLAARDKNLVPQMFEEIGDLDKVVKTQSEFLNFLKTPRVSENDKLSFVASILTDRVHPMLVQLMIVLIEKHRIGFLPEIIDEFNRLVEAERGIGRATVITATELNNSERKKLVDKLSEKLKLKVILEEEIDKDIVGGMIVITHDQIIDGSVRHGLDIIEQTLHKVRVA